MAQISQNVAWEQEKDAEMLLFLQAKLPITHTHTAQAAKFSLSRFLRFHNDHMFTGKGEMKCLIRRSLQVRVHLLSMDDVCGEVETRRLKEAVDSSHVRLVLMSSLMVCPQTNVKKHV